jgi:hypothetical protein
MTRIVLLKRSVLPMIAKSNCLLSFCLTLCACSADADFANTNSHLQIGNEVPVKMLETISSADIRWQKDSRFDLVTTQNIKIDNETIIPDGSKGIGRIICIANRGAPDNSSMIVIELAHLIAGQRRIPIDGTYIQLGHGPTLEYRGSSCEGDAVFASGKKAVIPVGRTLIAKLEADLVL